MLHVTAAGAAPIRAVYEQQGELSAVIELSFPGITDTAQARVCAETIIGRAVAAKSGIERSHGPPGGSAHTSYPIR
jgi:hypothetical protein